MQLTGKQRSHLRSLAHHIKPFLHFGKEGVGETSALAVEDAFNSRELLKVKVLDTAPDEARAVADQLADRIAGAAVVQVIGRTIVLYRKHPDKPQIKLP